jgi:hypothetical protein
MGTAFHVIKDLAWKMEIVLSRMAQRSLILCAESMIGKRMFVFSVRKEALRTSKASALKFLLSAKLRINSTVHHVMADTSSKTVNVLQIPWIRAKILSHLTQDAQSGTGQTRNACNVQHATT